MLKVLRIPTIIAVLILYQYMLCFAQNPQHDSLLLEKQEHFYDSLKVKANEKKVTGWLYDALISPPRPYVDKKALALDYFNPFAGKIIAEIDIQSLDVFGPTLNDTAKQARHWAEKAANAIHTKSNLKTIKKRLLFEIGDVLDPEIMYENERLIRNLPYIRDTKILVEQDSIYPGLVNVLVLTKDRFSFGVSGGVDGVNSGDLKIYNRNIFGVGHELSLRFVGHLSRRPYLGLESYYSINNIAGKYLDVRLGYLNTYRQEGVSIQADKPFYLPSTQWAYGANFMRMYRTERLLNTDTALILLPLNLLHYQFWGGHGFNISPSHEHITQLILSAGVNKWKYFEKPAFEGDNANFLANQTLFMAGITLSQRRFIQDELIYSYGIVEDIPEGFKNEFLYGYDVNDTGNRHYLHFITSNGNLLLSRSGYIFMSAGIGGFLNEGEFEEGQIRGELNFISRLYKPGRRRLRFFADANYTLGIRRYEIENLTLDRYDHIRGFDSDIAVGKQRLNLKLEHVMFFPTQYYKFNMALFAFADMGFIGSNKRMIFREDFYSGFGFGMRLHNENLVFETIRLRFAFYPFFPNDFHFFGFVLNEQSKRQFTTFETKAPQPMPFQ